MERKATIEEARGIFGKYFIGKEELLAHVPFIDSKDISVVPELPYSLERLILCADEYILILGVSTMSEGRTLSLIALREYFGISPDEKEPCFYNQDWYLNENFISQGLENRWYLIKRNVYEDTRAVVPTLLESTYMFPLAVECAYAFFVCWYCCRIILWEYDFIWCNDKDHNDDRIYVGKYKDIDGINKNGFSIHRHLALRNCYGSVDCIKG